MPARSSAELVARWFTAWAEAEDAEVSNLKLQKLLYYAQGHHLAERGAPLFDDEMQAWSHGPVVQAVYHRLEQFGSGDVVLADTDDFTWDQVDDDTAQFLVRIWNRYGPIAAWTLRNMTHASGPWKRHFVPDERHIVIPKIEICDFFAQQRRPTVQIPSTHEDRSAGRPTFCLRFVQRGFDVADLDKDRRADLAMALQQRASMTWRELHRSARHGQGYELIPRQRLSAPIPAAFADRDRFHVFRYSGTLPMAGVRSGEVFHIVWIEARSDELYDHG